jgi:hypothetical protein
MEPDRLTAALACVGRDALTRLSRSLAWNARRSHGQGRPARAAWQEALRGLLDDELAIRAGHARCRVSPTILLRRACLELPERDRVVLATRHMTRLHDVECHALGPFAGLLAVLADELRQSVSTERESAPRATVPSGSRRP